MYSCGSWLEPLKLSLPGFSALVVEYELLWEWFGFWRRLTMYEVEQKALRIQNGHDAAASWSVFHLFYTIRLYPIFVICDDSAK